MSKQAGDVSTLTKEDVQEVIHEALNNFKIDLSQAILTALTMVKKGGENLKSL